MADESWYAQFVEAERWGIKDIDGVAEHGLSDEWRQIVHDLGYDPKELESYCRVLSERYDG